MVTEYAEGPSLAEYIDGHGLIGPDMLYGLATGLAEALTMTFGPASCTGTSSHLTSS
jgi:hypothetical protein